MGKQYELRHQNAKLEDHRTCSKGIFQAMIRQVIIDQLIGSGLSGWMADFGEALPFDAILHTGTADLFHNQYPEVWAKLNREAIYEAGQEGNIFFFTRSGFTHTPQFTTLSWLGDQLTSWKREDGIYSAIAGLVSSGLSGYSQITVISAGTQQPIPHGSKPVYPSLDLGEINILCNDGSN